MYLQKIIMDTNKNFRKKIRLQNRGSPGNSICGIEFSQVLRIPKRKTYLEIQLSITMLMFELNGYRFHLYTVLQVLKDRS